MNECNSDNVRLSKAIRGGNYDILKLYSDMLVDLTGWANDLVLCCTRTKGSYEGLEYQLDVLIQNLLDCCEAINGILDEWIDTIIGDNPDPPVYFNEWIGFICSETDDPKGWSYNIIFDNFICEQSEDWPKDVYDIEWGGFICSWDDPKEWDYYVQWIDYACIESKIPPEPPVYTAEFTDFTCEEEWECDLVASFVECVDVIEYNYIAVWDGYVCLQEDDSTTSTTTELATTSSTTSTTETTTTTELQTTTTTELVCDIQFEIIEVSDEDYPTTTTTSTTTLAPTTTSSTTTETTYTTTAGETTTSTTPFGCVEYGLLYNWYAAIDARKISSSDDWVVPNIYQFQILADALGAAGDYTTNSVGGKLKEVGISSWSSPNTGATNESGFHARGGGILTPYLPSFAVLKEFGYFISTTEHSVNDFNGAFLYYDNSSFLADVGTGFIKTGGFSIRLVNPNTTKNDGDVGTYTGNDGTVYNTICIGSQEWLAENLAETKFRDNSSVPYVSDTSLWISTFTAALIPYNNDWYNVGCGVAPTTTTTTEYETTTTTLEEITTTSTELSGPPLETYYLKETIECAESYPLTNEILYGLPILLLYEELFEEGDQLEYIRIVLYLHDTSITINYNGHEITAPITINYVNNVPEYGPITLVQSSKQYVDRSVEVVFYAKKVGDSEETSLIISAFTVEACTPPPQFTAEFDDYICVQVYEPETTTTTTEYDVTTTTTEVSLTTTPEGYCAIFIPMGFSPNGDGIHDVFEILNLDCFPDHKMIIFTRSGTKIYETTDHYNNPWNGRWNNTGNLLPAGNYVYVLETYRNGTTVYNGTVMIAY